jgi:hypothetical protein
MISANATVSTVTVQFVNNDTTLANALSTATSTLTLLQSQTTGLASSTTSAQLTLASVSASVGAYSTTASTAAASASAQVSSGIAALSTQLSRVASCSALNLAYDSVANTCRSARSALPDWTASSACSLGNRGETRFNQTYIVMCNGASWVVAYQAPLGSAINPAASCAAIIESGDMVYGNGTYYMRLADGSVSQIVCEGSIQLGGDGQTLARAAASCAVLQTYFNLNSTFAFIDSTSSVPTAASAIRVYCHNGVSQGGDGSSIAKSAISCSPLSTYWGKTAGMYHVNGVSRYVRGSLQCFLSDCLGLVCCF